MYDARDLRPPTPAEYRRIAGRHRHRCWRERLWGLWPWAIVCGMSALDALAWWMRAR